MSCTWQGLTFHVSACRPAEYYPALALLPATLTKLTLFGGQEPPGLKLLGTDVAPLARLTQLKELKINPFLTSPLPQLPALTYFVGCFHSDLELQALSNVSATIKYLHVYAPELDLRQPIRLTCFSRLHTLRLSVECILGFHPEMLPPTLRYIEVKCDSHLDENLVFPVGNIVICPAKARNQIKWTCPL